MISAGTLLGTFLGVVVGAASGWLFARWRARVESRGPLRFSPKGLARIVERDRRRRAQAGARA